MATRQHTRAGSLRDLVPRLLDGQGFADVVDSLCRGNSGAIDGAWGSSCALVAATLAGQARSTLLVVLPRIRDIDEFAEDVAGFFASAPAVFPVWESLPDEHTIGDAVFGSRLQVLNQLESAQPPPIVVTSIAALLQPVPTRADRQAGTRRLRVRDEVDIDALLGWLVDSGFERVTAIELPGEFSMHGGILDIFPTGADDPLRIELVGDEIESMRWFDVATQRKREDVDLAALTIIRPSSGAIADHQTLSERNRGFADGASVLDSLPQDAWVVLSEPQELIDEGRHYLTRLAEPRGMYSVDATIARCTDFPSATIAAVGADSMETTCHLRIESIERFSGARGSAVEELREVASRDEQILIACHNEGERERLHEILMEIDSRPESTVPLADRVILLIGSVSRGFRIVDDRIVVIGDHELFGRQDVRRLTARRRKPETRAIDSFLELQVNDLVVHLTNGIGRYRGMRLLEKDEQVEEHLEIEFRDRVRVYVPVSLIHLVQKYVGAAQAAPLLSRLGGTSWAKKKQKVAEAVSDMASSMLRLQAEREAKPGFSCDEDSHLQHEFEAAFPYPETDDQLTAIGEIRQDMELNRPMDRLICGDVGYGKTEVAMRAAFKCIDNGRQVAVLVPTTVLAEQHFRTFSERMAEYPINIEVLSRFRSKGQQRKILEAMQAGRVDLVVGTHRLVQKDVRFRNIGLLVIDEEQRFGVEAKETLKQLRLEIDILTLTATPIPRTLHMSLLGIRDISNLTTAPQDRLAIETRICRFDGQLIRNAVIREMNRNGQVYFVHNRVHNIHRVADRIRDIVPEATIDVAHGQMSEHQLEAAMFEFVSGRTDVLVATTIIESGLDIPNANTIFIHDADIYGLADLHQLRGRVGRYRHRAYCYLLMPQDRPVTPAAAKRLKAIEEYSELGAGFKIAMRDLEIRGAGSILGTEQSGHISAVGYELYCHLLENAVRRLNDLPPREQPHVAIDLPISAYVPNDYVPPGRSKIEVYRRLSSLDSIAEVNSFREELRDRFGPLPDNALRLLQLKELHVLACRWKIDDIHLEDGYAVFGYRDQQRIRDLALANQPRIRIVDSRTAYLPLEDTEDDEEALYAELRDVLAVQTEPLATAH